MEGFLKIDMYGPSNGPGNPLPPSHKTHAGLRARGTLGVQYCLDCKHEGLGGEHSKNWGNGNASAFATVVPVVF